MQAGLARDVDGVGRDVLGAGLLDLEIVLDLHVAHVQLTHLCAAGEGEGGRGQEAGHTQASAWDAASNQLVVLQASGGILQPSGL